MARLLRRSQLGVLAYFPLAIAAAGVVTSAAAAPGAAPGKLVFATAGDETDRLEIASVRPDGTGMKKLTQNAVAGFSPRWVAGGRKLLFWTVDSFTERGHRWSMQPDGRKTRKRPLGTYSPSGRQLAQLTNRGVTILAASGRRLRHLRLRLREADFFNVGPLWSPDERYIALSIASETSRTDYERVFVARADRRAAFRSISKKRPGYYESPLAWYPVGHSLLIRATTDGSKARTVYKVSLDGARREVRNDFTRGFEFDLSPKGAEIAYVTTRGTILVAPLPTGAPRVLAKLKGERSLLSSAGISWSPSGRDVAFSDERGISIVRADGSGRRRVTRLGAWAFPSWSPDEERIAFSVGYDEIYVARADGRGIKRLTKAIWDDSPRWSPDGSRVAFLRGSHGLDDDRAISVFVMDASGARQRRLGRGYGPRWNADGRQVVYVDVAGSTDPRAQGTLRTGRVTIADSTVPGRRVVAAGTAPSFSPDGSQLAFMRYAFGKRGSPGEPKVTVAIRSTLFLIRADGTDLRELMTTSLDAYQPILYRPDWSPDGRTIALHAPYSDDSDQYGIALVDPAAPSGWRVLQESLYKFAWSPDGSRFAFTDFEGVHTMRSDGSQSMLVAKMPLAEGSVPVWSPDGTSLAFVGCIERENSDTGICDIYIVGAEGGAKQRVTRTPGMEGALDWWGPR
jgi:Tol biopolymer transport system component